MEGMNRQNEVENLLEKRTVELNQNENDGEKNENNYGQQV